MRVLVLHSDVSPDAPADELDTLVTAKAVADVLAARGHQCVSAAFKVDPEALRATLSAERIDIVFNMVESVFGDGALAPLAPAMLERLGVPFTGCRAASMAASGDKPLTKTMLRAAGLPTADWAEPPHWHGVAVGRRYIVKSATEDASLGLDDDSVVTGPEAVRARAALCERQYGGRWFAEAYLEGREFNVALLDADGDAPLVLPIPEMRFEAWSTDRPRIVGYEAKWNEASEDAMKTVRAFGFESEETGLAGSLRELACKTWSLLAMRGYARVDFRTDAQGLPKILEANPNPCLEPLAGFAAAGASAGIPYTDLVERILLSARR
jgi:D-alanine-D-alanine ligase